jgi:hypothetical protein
MILLMFVTCFCFLDVIPIDLVTVASNITHARAFILAGEEVVVACPDLQAVIIAQTNRNLSLGEVPHVFAFLDLARITDEAFHLFATRSGIGLHADERRTWRMR